MVSDNQTQCETLREKELKRHRKDVKVLLPHCEFFLSLDGKVCEENFINLLDEIACQADDTFTN